MNYVFKILLVLPIIEDINSYKGKATEKNTGCYQRQLFFRSLPGGQKI